MLNGNWDDVTDSSITNIVQLLLGGRVRKLLWLLFIFAFVSIFIKA